MNYLLLRGLAREGGHWHEFADTLARASGGRVERLDLTGCGSECRRTPRPSVPWLARDVAQRWQRRSRLPPTDWTVIGLSLGGMIALELCRLLPRCFARAVIINSSSRASPLTQRLSLPGLYLLLRALASRDTLARERSVLALTSALPAEARARFAERAASLARVRPASRLAVGAQLLAAAGFTPPPPSTIHTPLTFLCSRRDRLVSSTCSRQLAAYYASALVEHPWAGHDLPLDDPDWLCARVLDLDGVTPSVPAHVTH